MPVTAPPYVFDEPAAADDQEPAALRPSGVVFEEPEPAFLDEQLEPWVGRVRSPGLAGR